MKKYNITTVYESDYKDILEEYPALGKVAKESERGTCYIEAENLEQVLNTLEPIMKEKKDYARFCIARNSGGDWIVEIYDTWRE